jgi:hypothetical protein
MPSQIQDVGGLGVIVGHVKDLILKFFEYWSQRVERKLKYESLRLQLAREFLQLANDSHMTPEELMTLIQSLNLIVAKPPYFSKSKHYSENPLPFIHRKAQ